MNKPYHSEVSGLQLVRKYAYMPEDQWQVVDALRMPLGLSVSQYISHLIIAAAKAKESNDRTRPSI
jgi:hypothetical protein